MMRGLWIVLLFVVCNTLVFADEQAEPLYRLRQPTLEEYLTLFADEEFARTLALYEALPEMFALYPLPYEVNFDLLIRASNSIRRWANLRNYGETIPIQWIESLLWAWLREHPVNLEDVEQFQFEDFQVEIFERLDFNQDGQNEYILRVFRGHIVAGSNYYKYFPGIPQGLLAFGGSVEAGYHPLSVKLPIMLGATYSSDEFDSLQYVLTTVAFEDLNGDALPEWVLSYKHKFEDCASCIRDNVLITETYIISWQNEALVDLAPKSIQYEQSYLPPTTLEEEQFYVREWYLNFDDKPSVVWHIRDVDGDGIKEIQNERDWYSNWDCHFHQVVTFKWDDAIQKYAHANTQRDYPLTVGCLRHRSVEQLWNQQYKNAISLLKYHQALINLEILSDEYYRRIYFCPRFECRSTATTFPEISATYAQLQLMLAYAMNEQHAEISPLLESLKEIKRIYDESDISSEIEVLMDKAFTGYGDNQSAFGLCAGMYNAIVPSSLYVYGRSPVGRYISTFQYDNLGMLTSTLPDPARDGCDADAVIDDIIANNTFPLSKFPAEILTNAGMEIFDTFQADLNGDGLDEWLVWSTAWVAPVFFVADTEAGIYQTSRPYVMRVNRRTQITFRSLPDNTGIALVRLADTDNRTQYQTAHYGRCPADSTMGYTGSGQGRFQMWRLIGTELVELANGITCGAPWKLTDIYQMGGQEIHIMTEDYCDFDGAVADMIYRWISEEQRYHLDTTPLVCEPSKLMWLMRRVQYSLEAGEDISYKLKEVDDYLALLQSGAVPPEPNTWEDYVRMNRYIRATILESIGREEDALKEYVSLVNENDDKWGQLAALHIEQVER